MNISKAIEILEIEHHLAERQPETDVYDAIKLGIEAMKRHRDRTSLTFSGMMEPLPGETEE